jgi:hypothetical protein
MTSPEKAMGAAEGVGALEGKLSRLLQMFGAVDSRETGPCGDQLQAPRAVRA